MTNPVFEMSAEVYRGTVSEAQWRSSVLEYVRYAGWEVILYIGDTVYREMGRVQRFKSAQAKADLAALTAWPDLVIGNELFGMTVYVELKTNTGPVTTNQRKKLGQLIRCGSDARVWRPEYIAEVDQTLSGVRPERKDATAITWPGITEAHRYARGLNRKRD